MVLLLLLDTSVAARNPLFYRLFGIEPQIL